MSARPETAVEGELRSYDPATLEPVGAVPETPVEAVPELVAEARLAQRSWAESSHVERRALLTGVAQVLLDEADEIAATITAETGKPLVESYLAEVFVCLDHLTWTAANAQGILRDERLPFPQPFLKHKRARLIHEPLGVVAVVSPWNFPLGIPLTQAASAVAAGNAVVVKPSELTPLTGALVEHAFRRAGAPAGLVRVVQGPGPTVGEALARSRGVAKIFFTGSSAVGRSVAVAAGERLCPVTLELGGKDAMVVLEDADLDRAVEGALWGAFSNCGQSCASVERIYVARDLYEAFAEELARRAQGLRIGAGSDFATELGPLVSEERRDRVEQLVGEARADGAEVRAGAERPQVDLPGWFYAPTVLTGVHADSGLAREEVFGPVVAVSAFANEDDAVRLANDSAYGLSASVWTADSARAAALARKLEAGSVWANDVQYSYGAAQTPWGGRKESGFGRTHSKHGLYECAQVKFADFDRGRVPVPWWYPYGERAYEGFRGMGEIFYGEGLGRKLSAAWRHRRGLLELGRRYLG